MVIAPVYSSELTAEDLTQALERVLAQGNPKVPSLGRSGPPPTGDALLKAAGVRSRKTLARGGASYTVEWLDTHTTLYVSTLDEKGRFVDDTSKRRRFAPGAPIPVIVEYILQDVRSRPELLAG